jgi:uncharacterized iron-regulated protein
MQSKPLLWTLMASAVLMMTGLGVATADKRRAAVVETCNVASGWLEPASAKSKSLAANKVLANAAEREFVLLGEQHDDADHHRWQLQTLAGLYAYRPDMVIGFEMFPRRLQPVLDRWVEGKLTVREFLTQAEWDTVWSFPPELYLPLFEFARINRIPMVALNVERSLTKAIGEKGWDNVPAAERAGLSRPAPPLPAYRDILSSIYREHMPGPKRAAGKLARTDKATDKAFEAFVDAQLTWDRAMAEGLANRAVADKNGNKPLLVGIMGSGHLRYGHGVPHQLRTLGFNQIATLLPRSEDMACDDLESGLADAVFTLPVAAKVAPQPPLLGVALEDAEGSVRVQSITAGSLAERSGFAVGDRLIEVAGSPPGNTWSVISIIRRQPPGTWLPLRVQRGETALDLVVRFPAKT